MASAIVKTTRQRIPQPVVFEDRAQVVLELSLNEAQAIRYFIQHGQTWQDEQKVRADLASGSLHPTSLLAGILDVIDALGPAIQNAERKDYA